jgi:hypothetical protein
MGHPRDMHATMRRNTERLILESGYSQKAYEPIAQEQATTAMRQRMSNLATEVKRKRDAEAFEEATMNNMVWWHNCEARRVQQRLDQGDQGYTQAFMAITTDNDIETSDEDENWLVDSGATVHVTNSDTGMTNIETTDTQVIIGDGSVLTPTRKGTLRLTNDKGQVVTLHEVLHVPTFKKNILSVGSLMATGNTLQANANNMTLERNGATMSFTRHNNMFYLICRRRLDEVNASTAEETDNPQEPKDPKDPKQAPIDINEAHDKMGHFGEAMLRKTYKDMGVTLTGKLKPCDGCLRAKAKRKAISKISTSKATKPGERICIDISGPYTPSIIGSIYWGNMVDENTNKTWNAYMKKKSEFPAAVLALCDKLKADGKEIKFIRCDNAGENMTKLQEGCDKRGIKLEYTAPNTPQMNGTSERRFLTDRDRALAMLLASRLVLETRNKLWAEAVNAASEIGNLGITSSNDKSCDELFTGIKSKKPLWLIEFGRIGYVTIRNKIKPKMVDKTIKCINLGPAKDHAADCYRLYNPATEKVIHSRDIRWAEWERSTPTQDLSIFEGNIPKPGMGEEIELYESEEEETTAPQTMPPELTHHHPVTPAKTRAATAKEGRSIGDVRWNPKDSLKAAPEQTARMRNEARRLEIETPSNLEVENAALPDEAPTMETVETEEETNDGKTIIREVHFVFNTALMSDPGTPATIEEALSGPERVPWLKSIKEEVNNFLSRKAWKTVSRKEVKLKGRKIVPQKWVFKKKLEQDRSIRYKTRSVTKGFLQIPGVDFTESFSPVANDSTIRIGIGLVLYNEDDQWIAEVFDVEAAFLNAILDIEMFVEWPKLMVELGFISQKEHDETCIQLVKSQYGNVDAALRWLKTFTRQLTEMGLTPSDVDPCLFYKRDPNTRKVILLVIVYVDDILCCGPATEIEWLKAQVRKSNNITELGRLNKYLGLWYKWGRDKDGPFVKATMNDMAETIIGDYEKHVGRTIKEAKTPGFPGTTLTKSSDKEAEGIETEKYRSLVGKIMYYVVKIAPDCANAARELSQYMAQPTAEHWRAMERLVGYLKHKGSHHLIYRKPRELRVIGSADSNYATSPDDRKSISGNIHTLGGMITSWASKKQASVTLSSTEAEYVSLASHFQETRFQQQLLQEIAVNVIPAIVYEDNQGCIYLVKNQQVGARTKHIDIRMHFMRNICNDGLAKVIFTPSEDNDSDILTKNVVEKIFEQHAPNILNGTLRYWKEDVKMDGLSSDRLTSDPVVTSPEPTVEWKSVIRKTKEARSRKEQG